MELIKKAKWAYIAVSAVMILLGIVLTAFPGMSLETVCTVMGGLSLLFGIVKLAGYFSRDLFRLAFQFDLAFGLFCMIVGVFFLTCGREAARLLPVIIGGVVLLDGAFKVQTALEAKQFGIQRWALILLLAVVTCLSGALLAVDHFTGTVAPLGLMGVTLVVDGTQNLCVVACTVGS